MENTAEKELMINEIGKITVKDSEWQEVPENDPGYRRQYVVTVIYKDKEYVLVFQAQTPEYLSGDWIAREQDGISTGPFLLSNETGDDYSTLLDDLGANCGVEYPEDFVNELVLFVKDQVIMESGESE